jgi:tetratricopeptide (TPR) repeat protein
LKNWESAQRLLIKAKRLAGHDYLKKDILLYNLGLSFQMADQPQNAIPYYTQATEVVRNFGEAIYNLGTCYLQTGDKDKALIEISRARSIFEDNHQIPMIKQADKTLVHIMNSLQKDPPSFARQLLEKSKQYKDKSDTDAAIALARVSIIIFPQYVDAYYQLGIYYVSQGDTAQATQCFQSALGLKPTFAPAYIELGKIYETSTKFNLALTNYFKALKLDDTNPFVYYKIGLIHQKTGRNLKAREWFRKAKVLALKKNDTALLADIAKVYKTR